MKVNLNVELDDAQRNALARLIDGKEIKRLATRDEVREFVAGTIASLVSGEETVDPEHTVEVNPPARRPTTSELLIVDPEDEAVLQDKEPGFIMGWNRWKRRRDR